MYDIFFVGELTESWGRLKKIYPEAQRFSNISIKDLQKKSFTKMFWVVYDDLILCDNFNLREYRATKWDSEYVHVFKNGNYYDGISLIPKNQEISNKEFNNRFFVNKKEIDIIASHPIPFEIFYLGNYDDYLEAVKKSKLDMFWVVWNNIELDEKFNFEYYVPFYDSFHRNITHVFKNNKYHDGVCLFSKKSTVTKKEFDHRFFSSKKEIDIIASRPKPFDVFYINSYEDYLNALKETKTPMFWAIWNDVELKDFKFDYQVPAYNHFIVHIFKNANCYDGICLFPKNITYARREIEKRFFQDKKEIDIIASRPKPFDIVFISYNEPYAEEHYRRLLKIVKRPIHRINGVKGIHNAHIEAAKLVKTTMFWVVDADAEVVEDFKFDHQVLKVDQDIVFVWRSKNPVNGLEYGNGGVKLLPTKLTLEMKKDNPDMTTSISGRFRVVPEISNITKFNTDPFNSWKSAFRECSKLASRIITGQVDEETQYRLEVWCNETTDSYALDGARRGKEYGYSNRNNIEELKKINDFEWLREQFDGRQI